MERNVNYILVGVFVAVGIAGIIGFLTWVVGSHEVKDLVRYTIYFDRTVNGLDNGSSVRYRGVTVGEVTAIRLDQSRSDLIKVDIEIEKQTPVHMETTASLESQGITGLSYIQLITNKSDKGLPENRENEKYPVIQARLSQLDQLFEGAPKLTNNLLGLAEQLKKIFTKLDYLLDEQNQIHITETLRNFNNASHQMVTMFDNETVQNISGTMKNANALTEQLEKLTVQMNSTFNKVDGVISAVASNEKEIQQFSGQGLNDLMQLLAETRTMIASVNHLAESLQERPSRIIFQPNYEGVKIEK
jgi:phospholipid/cholesterol/gamma-HCH transport system substrate-binding protein